MIATVIVIGTGVLAGAFCVAWLLRPGLRAWIEAPKHQFQDNLRRYDRGQRAPTGPARDTRRG